jgi:hypothetical protein
MPPPTGGKGTSTGGKATSTGEMAISITGSVTTQEKATPTAGPGYTYMYS